MWPTSEKVRTTASVVAISATLVSVVGYFARLDGRVSQLEEQIRSMATTVVVADRLNGRVTQLEEQMRSLAASSGATVVADDRLNGRVSQLEETMRSLAASSAATAAAITDVSRKSAVAINPILQKCAELADEANTGQRYTTLGSHYGADVIKNALIAMEKLGCGSTVR